MLDVLPVQQFSEEKVQVPSGVAVLAGRLFLPIGPASGAVILNPAMGVPQSYYRDFAHWVASERHMVCLTYDYRDFGASKRTKTRHSDATMSDWGLIDQQSSRDYLSDRFPELPLTVVGHSLGGLTLMFQERLDRIDRAITVASGAVSVNDHPWPYQALARFFWYGAGPVATTLWGYLPGTKLGFGADLPADVYWEWRRWSTTDSAYVFDLVDSLTEPAWPSEKPIKMLSLSDDDLCAPRSVERLAAIYGSGAVIETIDPARERLGAIGHLSLFQRKNAVLWPKIIEAEKR